MKDMCFLLASLLAVVANSQDITSYLNEIFKSGTLQGMKVAGSVKMTTGTDLSIDVLTSITNNDWSLESSFSLTDGKCDFREVEMGAKLNIVAPKRIQNILALAGIGTPIKIAEVSETVSFLPKDTNVTTAPIETTLDALALTNPSAKQVLELLGANAKFTVKNPIFMITGMSFQLFFQGSVMGPDAGICSNELVKQALQNQDATLCTDKGGIEVAPLNLGLQFKTWLAAANQANTYIDGKDGTITIGTKGLTCNLKPVHFQIKGDGSQLRCLGEKDLCQSAVRKALVDAINAQLPAGYKVDESQFDNLKISIDPTTGDVTINGDVYAGAGKDPSALVQALRDYVAKGGIFKIGDDDVAVKSRDITDDGDCLNDSSRVTAKACDPGEEPPDSSIPGGETPKESNASPSSSDGESSAGDFQPGKEEEDDTNNTMLVLGTILVTLAVVATVMGAVVAIKLMRKRTGTTHAVGMIRSNDGFNQMNDGDGFDSVMLAENPGSEQHQQAVWGDVVELRKDPAAGV